MVIANVTVVLDDGTPRAASVPQNDLHEVTVPLGAAFTLRLRVVSPAGVPVDCTGATAVWTAKRRPQDPTVLWAKSATGTRAGFDLVLAAADTRRVDWGRACHDVWHTAATGGARTPLISASSLVLVASVAPIP
ncbi:MAG: hypothetical protein WC700_18035 [Gemmatimonadaceae bacterium]|jgi:hypothetical protein